MFIPKGTIVMGKIHKYEHPNFVMSGDIVIMTPDGEKRIKAPCQFVSPAGTRRMGLALEDTVWVTVHQNLEELRDHEQLEDMCSTRTFEEYDQFKLLLEATPQKGLVGL